MGSKVSKRKRGSKSSLPTPPISPPPPPPRGQIFSNNDYPNSRRLPPIKRRPKNIDYDSFSDSDDDFEYGNSRGCQMGDDPLLWSVGFAPIAAFPVVDYCAWNQFNNFGYGYGYNNFEFEQMNPLWSNYCGYSPNMPMSCETFF